MVLLFGGLLISTPVKFHNYDYYPNPPGFYFSPLGSVETSASRPQGICDVASKNTPIRRVGVCRRGCGVYYAFVFFVGNPRFPY